MLNSILELAGAFIVIALLILLLIHVLPWTLLALGLVLAAGLVCHCRHQRFPGPLRWPWWRKDDGGQPTA